MAAAGRRGPRVARLVRWAPWLTGLAALVVFLHYVQVVPFVPQCEEDEYGTDRAWIWGPMTEDYRVMVKGYFGAYGVDYLEAGDLILLYFFPWSDGNELFNQGDGIWNATYKAAWALASKRFVGSMIGQELNGRIYRVPPHILALRDPVTGEYDFRSCTFLRAVILGPQGGLDAGPPPRAQARPWPGSVAFTRQAMLP